MSDMDGEENDIGERREEDRDAAAEGSEGAAPPQTAAGDFDAAAYGDGQGALGVLSTVSGLLIACFEDSTLL
jgi:hypothetical protein